eukprot:765604-Amphidinium_carterae.1
MQGVNLNSLRRVWFVVEDVAVNRVVDAKEHMDKSCVEIEDVDKLKLVLVGALWDMDELEFVERGVVAVNVGAEVDVEVDVEDVDELEFVLPLLVDVVGILEDVAVNRVVDYG